MATLRLVWHEWNKLVSPILWELLWSTFEVTEDKKLSALMDPNNQVLRYVRRIIVASEDGKLGKACEADVEINVEPLIRELPDAPGLIQIWTLGQNCSHIFTVQAVVPIFSANG